MRRKTLAGIAAAMLAVTGFAACGDDDDDDDTPTDTVVGGDVTVPEGTTAETEPMTTTS
jgi:hypothetical protein